MNPILSALLWFAVGSLVTLGILQRGKARL